MRYMMRSMWFRHAPDMLPVHWLHQVHRQGLPDCLPACLPACLPSCLPAWDIKSLLAQAAIGGGGAVRGARVAKLLHMKPKRMSDDR